MRALATLFAIGTTLIAQTTTTPTKPATRIKPTTHRSTIVQRPHPTSPTRSIPADPAAMEGVTAVGTMPAATGTPASLFTLRFIDLKVGDGEEARNSGPDGIVFYTVHYTGWTTDGKQFDSSVDRGEPIVFPVGMKHVITGWDTGFQGMRVGGKRRLIVPWQLAYGASGRPPVIPAKADLIFDLELIGQGNTQQPVTGTHFEAPEKPTAAPNPTPQQ